MEREQLLAAIKTTLNKTKVNDLTKIAAENNFSIKELIDLTFHKEDQIAFRASWILENIYISHIERFVPHTAYFLSVFSTQNNLSCRRHYGKILALLTSRRSPLAIKELIEKHNTEQLVETVFSWLIDEKVPVAIKSHCLNILANLNAKHNWIKDELLQTMDFLVDKESIAFYAKAKQIRKQLK
ncbi:hypothetical protein FA048_11270 [Pedobacter polaris]|uniref:Adenylosuccinate lyase n=1 Tax=Pedobacter polaris TaxID=2571273 RepID=A0A4U1CSJ2_9SPHI|nr:hypothetical protein [Pedobacter polaris]TKC10744.1 hypothetical protein FA048_11270 [Pedobacter polaris]